MEQSSPGRLAPSLVTALVGAWILTGALFKLLWGTPSDLPQPVKDFPLALDLTYKLAIGIELFIVTFALARPRIGWFLAAAQLAVFLGVLGLVMAQGAENCGCFGSSVTVAPWVMFTIDAVLLAVLLATRPWRDMRRGPIPFAAVGLLAALGLVLPWILDRNVPPPSPSPPAETGAETDGAQAPEPATPRVGSGYAVLEVTKWEGQLIFDTPLASWLAVDLLPLDGTWIFYRRTCDHCAEHLEELARTDPGTMPIVLIRIVDAHDSEENRLVHVVPSGDHVTEVTLPEGIDWVVTTPADLTLEGGEVKRAREGIGQDE